MAGSIFVERKKNSTSVHLRTGLIASAYAAGIDSSSTRSVAAMLAVAELIRAGHGLAPVEAPKNSRYPSRVSAAPNFGGLVPASDSLCSEVSTIHATGRKNAMPTTQATSPHRALTRRAPLAVVAVIAGPPRGTG